MLCNIKVNIVNFGIEKFSGKCEPLLLYKRNKYLSRGIENNNTSSYSMSNMLDIGLKPIDRVELLVAKYNLL